MRASIPFVLQSGVFHDLHGLETARAKVRWNGGQAGRTRRSAVAAVADVAAPRVGTR